MSKAESKTTSTSVEIFGSVYSVRGEQDDEYLKEVAALVDEKMRSIAKAVKTVDTAKIAILAALNLADDYMRGQREDNGDQVALDERVARMTKSLGDVLDVSRA